MQNHSKTIAGGIILIIGLVMVASSLIATIVSPSQSLMVNTFGILIATLGGLLIVGTSISQPKKLMTGLILVVVGMVATFYSFMIQDPFTSLWVNTVAIMTVITGGVLFVGKHEEKGMKMMLGGITAIVGIIIVVLSLTPLVSQSLQLGMNTLGILIFGLGGIMAVKDD